MSDLQEGESVEGEQGQRSTLATRFPKWKEYLDPRFLGAVSTTGTLNLTRPHHTTSWSGDNQVALITDGCGITVVDFVHTHQEEPSSMTFIGNETKVSCIRPPKDRDLENYVGIPLSSILQSKDKHEVFELARDAILSPKELTNAEAHLYYTKVSWTSHPLKLSTCGTDENFQYLLGTLDSHFNFRILKKHQNQEPSGGTGSRMHQQDDDWEVFVDVTESYRNLLLSQLWSVNVTDEAAFAANRFKEYKRRMYDLAIVNFMWLPSWKDETSSNDCVNAGLITAHPSGDICFWHLSSTSSSSEVGENVNQKRQLPYFLTLESRQCINSEDDNDIISLLDFYKVSPNLGLLIVGTTGGNVMLFKVKYNSSGSLALKPVPADETPEFQKYTLDDWVDLFEKDLLEAQNTFAVIQDKAPNECHLITLYVFKQPNFMFTFEIKFSTDGGIEVSTIEKPKRIVQGTLTGVQVINERKNPNQRVLLTVTQKGLFSWSKLENGQIKEVSSYELGAAEETNTGMKKRLQFGGLVVSPNLAMFCVSKTLAELYDHLELRSPSVLQFHSLFPTENVWPFVYATCLENKFQLQNIGDLLTAFRVLMSTSETYSKEVLDWAVPLKSKSLEDLQILLWILRVQPRVDKDQLALAFNLRETEPQAYTQLRQKQVLSVRRETLVSDKLMQLHCLKVIRQVTENSEKFDLKANALNLQSLMTMYDYLETKISLGRVVPKKPQILETNPPKKPACPLCGKPTKLQDETSIARCRWVEGTDYTVEHEMDKEKIEGVLWHEQQHAQKSRAHPISNCVLSLIPAVFPHRKCTFCGTLAMQEPAFQQKPICPFCNGKMTIPDEYYGEDEVGEMHDEMTNELQMLVKEIEEEQERLVLQKLNAAPLSRKARIENMYVD